MGCSKLREWVGTVTGKGDSWGRDSVGRSAPAFMAASTPALPPLTCTARGRRHLAAVFAAKPANCGPFVRGLCRAENPLAVVACSCFVLRAVCLLPFFACHAHCPSTVLAPVQFALCFAPFMCFCLPPVHSMCARITAKQGRRFLSVRASSLRATNCPVGSCNTGLQWRPVHRSI